MGGQNDIQKTHKKTDTLRCIVDIYGEENGVETIQSTFIGSISSSVRGERQTWMIHPITTLSLA